MRTEETSGYAQIRFQRLRTKQIKVEPAAMRTIAPVKAFYIARETLKAMRQTVPEIGLLNP